MKLGLFSKLAVVVAIGWATLTALPNVLPQAWLAQMPAGFPTKTLNLGLDLQGGSHLVLAVDLASVQQRALENLEDEIRRDLRESALGYRGLGVRGDAVVFLVVNPEQTAAIERLLYAPLRRDVQVDEAAFSVRLTSEERDTLAQQAVQQTVEVLRTRVDAFGVAEPVIQRQGAQHVIVELPGIDDVQRAKDAIGKTAQLTFHLVDDTLEPFSPLPADREVLYETTANGARLPVVIHKRPALTGEMLTSAGSGFDEFNQPAVNIAFNARGTRIFSKISADYLNRRFAIVLDGVVLSAPVFRQAIQGGKAQISGSFTLPEAQELATLLNAGALPAPVQVVEERTIGPSLGADSVAAGQVAMAVGFVLVLIFMVVSYGRFGLAADVALLVNVVLVLAVMTAVGFTLTLPGMAGIVLTIGMAVDANVLIFERIREEIARNVKPFQALENGFKGAFGTILDANITTLLASGVLFLFGSGPVKGFALTLSIGILASMFTAILLTRWLLVAYVHAAKPKVLVV